MDKKLFNQLLTLCKKMEKSNKIINRDIILNVGGVYLIKNKQNKKIEYVGKAKDLKRRINNHVSRGESKSTSVFRRKISKKIGIKDGNRLGRYISTNYDFYILEIDNPDMRSLIESLLIYKFRKNNFLLNDIK